MSGKVTRLTVHAFHTRNINRLGFTFIWRCVWRWLLPGLLHHVVWHKFTSVSDVLAVSIVRVISTNHPDVGGSKHLWNVRKVLQNYTTQQPRRTTQKTAKFMLRLNFLLDIWEFLLKIIWWNSFGSYKINTSFFTRSSNRIMSIVSKKTHRAKCVYNI
jgi:hypothetical protein